MESNKLLGDVTDRIIKGPHDAAFAELAQGAGPERELLPDRQSLEVNLRHAPKLAMIAWLLLGASSSHATVRSATSPGTPRWGRTWRRAYESPRRAARHALLC